ncbi:MAG: tRNA (guanosine(46)-N7)-methyltransferase TrmB [Chthoniobacterales bacterium]
MTEETRAARPAAEDFEIIPVDYFSPLAPGRIFSRSAPLEVDIGCGDGAFVVAQAERFPERNYLGLEKLAGRVWRACKKASRLSLTNVRFLRIDSSYAIQYLLPPASAEMVHLLFPDPWPKSKHRRRRMVTPEFLVQVHRLLVPNGRLRIVTDQQKYFEAIRALIAPEIFIEAVPAPEEEFPITTFEKHFLADGVAIHRLLLRKVE